MCKLLNMLKPLECSLFEQKLYAIEKLNWSKISKFRRFVNFLKNHLHLYLEAIQTANEEKSAEKEISKRFCHLEHIDKLLTFLNNHLPIWEFSDLDTDAVISSVTSLQKLIESFDVCESDENEGKIKKISDKAEGLIMNILCRYYYGFNQNSLYIEPDEFKGIHNSFWLNVLDGRYCQIPRIAINFNFVQNIDGLLKKVKSILNCYDDTDIIPFFTDIHKIDTDQLNDKINLEYSDIAKCKFCEKSIKFQDDFAVLDNCDHVLCVDCATEQAIKKNFKCCGEVSLWTTRSMVSIPKYKEEALRGPKALNCFIYVSNDFVALIFVIVFVIFSLFYTIEMAMNFSKTKS